jgi:hypothetical protein
MNVIRITSFVTKYDLDWHNYPFICQIVNWRKLGSRALTIYSLFTENIYVDVATLIVLFNHAVHYKCYSALLERDGMNFGAWLNNTDTGNRDVS